MLIGRLGLFLQFLLACLYGVPLCMLFNTLNSKYWSARPSKASYEYAPVRYRIYCYCEGVYRPVALTPLFPLLFLGKYTQSNIVQLVSFNMLTECFILLFPVGWRRNCISWHEVRLTAGLRVEVTVSTVHAISSTCYS